MPYLGEDSQFDYYSSKGLKPPTSPGLQEHNNVSGYLLRFGQYIKQNTVNVPSVDDEAVSKQNRKKWSVLSVYGIFIYIYHKKINQM